MTKIYLEASCHTEVTRERDDNDQWSGEDTISDWSFGEVCLSGKDYWRDSFPTDFDVAEGDVIYLVVAVWSTGDSFSRDDRGRSEVFGVFKDQGEASKYSAKLEASSRPVRVVTKRGKKATPAVEDTTYYPWHGYFEQLDYVEVLTRIVEP